MLNKYIDEKLIKDNLCEIKLYHNLDDREYWDKIGSVLEPYAREKVEHYNNYTFEHLYASLFREFATKQNRRNFEEKNFKRREALTSYILLEAIENKGNYIEKIMDMVWMICEETDWCLPAHTGETPASDSLPCSDDLTLDIFNASTAEVLMSAYELFGDKLDEFSLNIKRRIKSEINRRLVDNYLRRSDYWWQGFRTQECLNNWNPWVNSQVLKAAALFADDEIKVKIVSKILKSLNYFINSYPEDGACAEGPSYAMGSLWYLADALDTVCKMTGGVIDILKEQKLKNMADYFVKMYIYDEYVINFADADAVFDASGGILYKLGKIFGNKNIVNIALGSLKKKGEKISNPIVYGVEPVLAFAEQVLDCENIDNTFLEYIDESYLESLNIFSARESKKDNSGLFFAAKGGNNFESHNHNDVGNFIVYKDGEPFLCDSGRLVYTAVTFGPNRYTLWHTQSGYHNLPTINGKDQHNGKEYYAENVSASFDEEKAVFSLDIKNAYKNKEEIDKWVRTFVFDRVNHEIRVTEDYALNKCESIALNFLSNKQFSMEGDGVVMKSASGKTLKIMLDTPLYDIDIEEIEFDEENAEISGYWGGGLYRAQLKMKNPLPKAKICYTIK